MAQYFHLHRVNVHLRHISENNPIIPRCRSGRRIHHTFDEAQRSRKIVIIVVNRRVHGAEL